MILLLTPVRGDVRDAFHLLPLFERMFSMSGAENALSDAEVQEQIDKMKAQIGASRTHFRTGFAGIFRNETNIERNFKLARENDISLGLIISQAQTHALNSTIKNLLKADIRRYQWRLDGVNWFGITSTDGEGTILYPERDFNRVTSSRYAAAVRAAYQSHIESQVDSILRMNRRYPGVLAVVNAAIEEEMPTQGGADDAWLGDYSPFAITEFRDWLRHAGQYDAATGAHPGEGAPAGMVGGYLLIDGCWRSQFHDDPTPADSNGTGVSFNQHFGTAFTTWTLRYHDLEAYPDAIPYQTGMEVAGSANFFDISPEVGTGFTDGGFDAPRVRNIADNYWNAWSWDMLDHDPVKPGAYPPGDPRRPEFGFRQTLVRNWCGDVLDWARARGIPADLLYAHQIPGENTTAKRLRSGATPVWTGYYEPGKTLGITRFGMIETERLQRYARKWGVFEWHPLPWNENRPPTYPENLYADTISSLDRYYWAGARVLFPGWWTHDGTVSNDGAFPLADSTFASGMKDWLAAQPDRPLPVMGGGGGLGRTVAGSTVQLSGWIQPFLSETHTFELTEAGAAGSLSINGQELIAGASGQSAPVPLEAGKLHPIIITHSVDAVPVISWSAPSMPLQAVPLSQLYPQGDSDGDGMDDQAEAAAGRDARDAGDLAFHFNTDGDNEGWQPLQLSSIQIANGIHSSVSSGNDPKLSRSGGFAFDTREVPGFLVRMRASKTGPIAMYFGDAANSFNSSRLLTANLPQENAWRHVYLSGSASTEWRGFTVQKLRFDPTNQIETAIEIDSIRASDGDLDDDGIADTAEPAEDTDGDGILDVMDTDSDGDGHSDAAERIAGSDPYLISSHPPAPFFQFNGETRELILNGLENRYYSLFRCTDLVPGRWTEVDAAGPLSSNQTVILRDGEPAAARGFYRVRITE